MLNVVIRFKLRQLLAFYMVFACCIAVIAWRVDVVRKELRHEQDALGMLNGYNNVEYSTRRHGIGSHVLRMISSDNFNTQNVIEIDAAAFEVTDTQVDQLKDFCFLESLCLEVTSIGDLAVESIIRSQYASCIRYLDLSDTHITNKSLLLFNELDSLESLYLNSTNVSDNGLLKLKNENLRSLGLSNTGITDIGLSHVAEQLCVDEIGITNTACTLEGVERFLRHRSNPTRKITIFGLDITDEQRRNLQIQYPNAQILN